MTTSIITTLGQAAAFSNAMLSQGAAGFSRGYETLRRSKKVAKYGMFAMAVGLGLAMSVADASAFVCGRGAYRGGCVSSHGSFGIGRNGIVAVGPHGGVYGYHRGSSCYWYNSQRYCR